jgi:hypothetical protein
VTERESSNEDSYPSQKRIEEIESTDSPNADKEEECPLDT